MLLKYLFVEAGVPEQDLAALRETHELTGLVSSGVLIILKEGALVELDSRWQPAQTRDWVLMRRHVTLHGLRTLSGRRTRVLQRARDVWLHVDDLV